MIDVDGHIAEIKRRRAPRHGANGRDGGECTPPAVWPDPKPLPSGLLPVEKFSTDFMPAALGPWVEDIATGFSVRPTTSLCRRSLLSAPSSGGELESSRN